MAQIVPDNASTQRADSTVVSLEHIKQHPQDFLATLSSQALPNSFSVVEGHRAIDLGGVSKQVYFTLFSALIEKGLLSLNKEDIPKVDEKRKLEVYNMLGKFYAHFAVRNQDRGDLFLTGHVFSPGFFELIQQALMNQDDDKAFAAILKTLAPNFNPFFDLILEEGSLDKQQAVSALMREIGEEEADPVEFSKAVLESFIKPVKALLQGAKDSGVSSAFFRDIRSLSPVDLCLKLQGQSLTNDIVLAALRFNMEELTGAMEELTGAFDEKVGWLIDKISSADKPWLENLVFAMTGRKVLAQGSELKIKKTWIEGVIFEFHTCFNSLYLPKIAMNKDDFLQDLDASIPGNGYSTA
jgi:hypothetical protein